MLPRILIAPLLFSFCISLGAQWVLRPEMSAGYECILTTDEAFSTGGEYRNRILRSDTLAFELHRDIGIVDNGRQLTFQIQKTYERGQFRREQPQSNPAFWTDEYGNLQPWNMQPRLPGKMNEVDRSLYNYLRLTIIPYPADSLRTGYRWSSAFSRTRLAGKNGNAALDHNLKCRVVGQEMKLGRNCYKVAVVSTASSGAGGNSLAMEAAQYLDTQSGQLVYLELSGNYELLSGILSPSADIFKNRFRIRLALKDHTSLIADELLAWNREDAHIAQLTNTYKWIIPPVYDKIENAFGGRETRGYIITMNGRCGYLAGDGQVLFDPVFESALGAGRGLLRATSGNGYWALYNPEGKVVLDSMIWIEAFNGPVILAKNIEGYLFCNQHGNVLRKIPFSQYDRIIPGGPGRFHVEKDGKRGLIDAGGEIIPPVYTSVNELHDQDGSTFFSASSGTGSILFDSTGQTLLRLDFGEISGKFGDLLIVEAKRSSMTATPQFFLYRIRTGKTIGPGCHYLDAFGPHYFKCKDLSEDNYSETILDENGKAVAKFRESGRMFSLSDPVSSMVICQQEVSKGDVRAGIFDLAGKWVLPPTLKGIRSISKEGIVVGIDADNAMWGLITLESDTILPFEYRTIWHISESWYYILDYRQNGFFNAEDKTYRPLPPGLSGTGAFRAGDTTYLLVENGQKQFGLCDAEAHFVLQPEFDEIVAETPNGVLVKTQGKMGIIRLK